MQIFCAENRLERLRRQALERGDLVDVTDAARKLEIRESVCITKRLWVTIVNPYAFAQQSDYVPLSRLLPLVKAHLAAAKGTDASVLRLLPSQLPDWFRGSVSIKLRIISPPGRPRSIILQNVFDSFPSHMNHRDSPLPATLIARIGEALHNFEAVSRTTEQAVVRSMYAIVIQLMRPSPFYLDIADYLANLEQSSLNDAPPANVRSALLADLDELLAILRRYAAPDSVAKIEALRTQYRALVSPLSHFSQLLEDLLRLTSNSQTGDATLQSQIFSQLLQIYSNTSTRLHRFETQVPTDSLSVVRLQIRLLTQLLGPFATQFLVDSQLLCAHLAVNQLPYAPHGPLNECRVDVTWH